jgi:hypothetical protein
MSSHRYRIGQVVQLIPSISRNVSGGAYEITKQLPESGGEFEYRIKSMNERHERVVRESAPCRRQRQPQLENRSPRQQKEAQTTSSPAEGRGLIIR